mmetsp:Transcript_10989/g.23114  ORF Transcript_10989/g.23114 Transcript_10989/m.23114 type:complete len:277 (-) Transcript_10989:843-1673(-)
MWLRHARLPGHRPRWQENFATATVVGNLNHSPRLPVCRADDLDGSLARDVHLRGPIHALPGLRIIPHGGAIDGAQTHSLSEVHEHAVTFPKQHILQGDVAVAHIVPMEMPHRLQQLRHVAPLFLLRERLPIGDPLEELTPIAIVRDEVGGGGILENALQPDQVRASLEGGLQVGEDRNLIPQILHQWCLRASKPSALLCTCPLLALRHRLCRRNLRNDGGAISLLQVAHLSVHGLGETRHNSEVAGDPGLELDLDAEPEVGNLGGVWVDQEGTVAA